MQSRTLSKWHDKKGKKINKIHRGMELREKLSETIPRNKPGQAHELMVYQETAGTPGACR